MVLLYGSGNEDAILFQKQQSVVCFCLGERLSNFRFKYESKSDDASILKLGSGVNAECIDVFMNRFKCLLFITVQKKITNFVP